MTLEIGHATWSTTVSQKTERIWKHNIFFPAFQSQINEIKLNLWQVFLKKNTSNVMIGMLTLKPDIYQQI